MNPGFWLVRTSQNEISGPFSREELQKRVQEGAFEAEDEICAANGYWIYLYEREEVLHQLGVRVPDEVMEEGTDGTQEVTEPRTDPHFLEKLDTSSLDSDQGATTVVSTTSLRELEPDASPAFVKGVKRPPRRLSTADTTPVWKGIIWILLGVAGLLMLSVIRLLRSQ